MAERMSAQTHKIPMLHNALENGAWHVHKRNYKRLPILGASRLPYPLAIPPDKFPTLLRHVSRNRAWRALLTSIPVGTCPVSGKLSIGPGSKQPRDGAAR